jgi:multidrug efflux pump subunit AcrA (membrane-fusion protein)
MTFSEYVKPALTVVGIAALGVGYYLFEHRSHPQEPDMPVQASVVVTKATNGCFSDLVRATGFIVPRREAVVVVDQEGSKVTDVLVHEGDMVTAGQELARLSPPPPLPGRPSQGPISLHAPAAGLVTEVRTMVGAPASPQAGPMFRISVNNEIELEAQVPAAQMLKLNPDATVRISRDDTPDLVGRVRLISPEIDRDNQLGRVRISLTNNSSLKVGMFARASIDAKRSCGVAIPRTAIDHLTVQVVKDDTIETRNVQVGLVSDTLTEILRGLDVGDVVVADAGSSLHDGDQIKTVFADELDHTRGQ